MGISLLVGALKHHLAVFNPEGTGAALATVITLAVVCLVLPSLNLATGSAMAFIGLSIPAIAVAGIWLEGPLSLGLDPTQITLLLLTVAVAILTVVPGRAKPLQDGVHHVVLAAFLFMTISP